MCDINGDDTEKDIAQQAAIALAEAEEEDEHNEPEAEKERFVRLHAGLNVLSAYPQPFIRLSSNFRGAYAGCAGIYRPETIVRMRDLGWRWSDNHSCWYIYL